MQRDRGQRVLPQRQHEPDWQQAWVHRRDREPGVGLALNDEQQPSGVRVMRPGESLF